ncbi:MAG: hypothetical protein QG657_5829 [Acidobacteriota bacterium]|nr:hypothetical protein [Acidobacteriota bacterium]
MNEELIKDRRLICAPIKTGDNLRGKLAIKYSRIENDRAVKDNMARVLETIFFRQSATKSLKEGGKKRHVSFTLKRIDKGIG